MMLTGETFTKVLEVLRLAPGYFVFRDEAGEDYVVARKADFIGEGKANPEKQLALPNASSLAQAVRETAQRQDTTPGFVLDSINREIAKYTNEQQEQMVDDLSLEAAAGPKPKKSGKHIRFEPISGDLAPELQE